MDLRLARTLQVFTVIGALGLLLAQAVVIPVVSGWMAEAYPEFAWARWSLAIPLIAVLACVQVALLATWQLLGQVAKEEIFSGNARRWVDVMLGALSAAWIIAFATSTWQTVQNVSAPSILLGELLLLLVGIIVILLIVVLRGLLMRATELKVEMDAVV
ncbi:DUF2975 domain-containing protein [Flaviflexus huanghaiensis]|uniref:DUF2975 domain-containing protein n=1 Tax=Flaviflexus huanghaiensis TaxID=1111473 RepID=UPI0015FADE66|nr:DUF2975 domain-containing protein [Flaviflexus huanghaiensis]